MFVQNFFKIIFTMLRLVKTLKNTCQYQFSLNDHVKDTAQVRSLWAKNGCT